MKVAPFNPDFQEVGMVEHRTPPVRADRTQAIAQGSTEAPQSGSDLIHPVRTNYIQNFSAWSLWRFLLVFNSAGEPSGIALAISTNTIGSRNQDFSSRRKRYAQAITIQYVQEHYFHYDASERLALT